MKRLCIIPMNRFFFLVVVFFSLASCTEYSKVLKSDSVEKKYTMAKDLYDTGLEKKKKNKLSKSVRLLEQIQPGMRGKPQNEVVSYMIANAYYNIGDYLLAAYHFEKFVKSFPDSDKREESIFKTANSFYRASPRYSLDQKDTYKAIDKLQLYLNAYPDGEYFEVCNKHLAELRDKLDKKAYEIAKQFHHRGQMGLWRPAVHALNNFIEEHPGSVYLEKAYFYKLESQFEFAMNSFKNLERERIQEALKYYNDYVEKFPDGEFIKTVNRYYEEMQEELRYLDELNL